MKAAYNARADALVVQLSDAAVAAETDALTATRLPRPSRPPSRSTTSSSRGS